ncbi:MAG: nucleoside hydrolase, partial [Pseudomonadota bacterium]
GLDVTHQVIATEARVAAIREVGTKPAIATAGMLSFFNRYDAQKYGSDGAPLHDPCTIAYLLCPELFEGQLCNVSVETESLLTLGHTAVDFWHVTEKPKNALWIHGVDADGFYALLTDSLGRYETG